MVEELERSASEKTMPAGWVQRLQAVDPDLTQPSLGVGVKHAQAPELDPGTWALRQQILRAQGLARTRVERHKANKPI